MHKYYLHIQLIFFIGKLCQAHEGCNINLDLTLLCDVWLQNSNSEHTVIISRTQIAENVYSRNNFEPLDLQNGTLVNAID